MITISDHRFILQKHGKNEVIYFEASNQDLSSATYQYFGYISANGLWIIQRFHIIGSAIIYEYAGGKSRADYDSHWDTNGLFVSGSPALTFVTFDLVNANLK